MTICDPKHNLRSKNFNICIILMTRIFMYEVKDMKYDWVYYPTNAINRCKQWLQ